MNKKIKPYPLTASSVIPYRAKVGLLHGSNLAEIMRSAHGIYAVLKKKTKRRPYVRSAYFNKEKIFFDYYWQHLSQKSPKERYHRLKYFMSAIELIQYSRHTPTSKRNPNKTNEILHRFAGLTKTDELFFVHIKENIKSRQKYFMSCFPPG